MEYETPQRINMNSKKVKMQPNNKPYLWNKLEESAHYYYPLSPLCKKEEC